MEQALILGKLAYSFPRDIIGTLMKISGVCDANLIYGPYDFYVVANTKTKEALSDLVMKIRSTKGVTDTVTSYVVSMSDIRPEPKGPLAE
jgi:hypothetical protein